MATDIVKFTDDGGKPVQFTGQDVKDLVCSNATDKEVALFLAHCAKHNLDPIGAKDAYLIKYGNAPAQIITGFQVFNRRANRSKDYAGIEDGVVVYSQQRGIERRPGSAVYTEIGEQLLGGWARVSFKDGKKPAYAEVALKDFSTGKSNWLKMPGVMIDKVAKATAWRLAYPDEFGGMYVNEEMAQAQAQPEPQPVQQPVVQPHKPQKAELPDEWKQFMRSMSDALAKATGNTPNGAAHAIIAACGQPVPTQEYGQAVQAFVAQAGQQQAQPEQPVYAAPQQAEQETEPDEGEWEEA